MTFGKTGPKTPVVIHFHGAEWLPRQAAREAFGAVTVAAIHLGSGSSVYEKAFSDPNEFHRLLADAEAGDRPVILSSFSAGYGAIRAILRHSSARVSAVVLMDSLHAGNESMAENLAPFLSFAKDRRKRLLLTHSEVFPGTFASTTETADYLARELGGKRRPVLRWGPGGMQQIAEAKTANVRILSFAGNSAPDHVDHFHAAEHWYRQVLRKP